LNAILVAQSWLASLDFALEPPLARYVVATGVALGYLLFLRRWGRPWGRAYRVANPRLVLRVSRGVRVAFDEHNRRKTGTLTRSALGEIEAFYVRWLNLPRDEREELRESLHREGIDIIRLGDVLRWYRFGA
jgi:hypothetical protein